MDPELQQLGVQLADVGIRNMGSAVSQRVQNVKAKREDKETIKVLEEIINDLVDDKHELVRIAQAYEDELVAQRISEDDIEFISGHLVPLVTDLAPGQEEVVETIEKLLSVESVTVLQLLGFNFRKALGEPLTNLVSQWITAQSPQPKKQVSAKQGARRK